MPWYRVVFQRPETAVEADSKDNAEEIAYDWVCDEHHWIDYVEEIPNG